MTDTLIADDDANEPEKVDGNILANAFRRWVDDFRAELNARKDSADVTANSILAEVAEREYVLMTQPFSGDATDLDDENIGERLWSSAWDRAADEAQEAGKKNVTALMLQGVGRSLFGDGEWRNAATWSYVRW